MHTEPLQAHCSTVDATKPYCASFLSWGAIFAGALIAVGVSFLFHLLSFGLGLAMFTKTVGGLETLLITSFIWAFLGGYLIYFFAGWVTGRLCHTPYCTPCKGALLGLLAWCLALVLSLFLTGAVSSPNVNILNAKAAASSLPSSALIPNLPDQPNKKEVISEREQDIVHTIGIATLATFFIFLAGAVGSAVGGYFGAKGPIRRHDQSTTTTTL